LARAWFDKLPHCTLLDTTALGGEEVFAIAVEWMSRHGAGLTAHGSGG
jgi:hypothetical protein